jgi:AraC family transcriptional regulator, regulatory protein of adaptative response / DNA-3-methyladenine glycosylase II
MNNDVIDNAVPTNHQYRQARLSRDARFDGLFFVAVKTTGIFCRPICPATPPKEQNVAYYAMAQLAMQAGYRPCLRCRPESAPHSFAWKGVDTTVERGLMLLAEHPDLSVAEISAKLGITDRYFRQLFQQKLGISPKQYQLFEQLLFAKQLLHQSALTVEHIAQASGFLCARRLQDNLKRHTSLTPSQIRQIPRRPSQLIEVELPFRPPYNWPHVRDFLARRAVAEMEEVKPGSYARTFSLNTCKGWFSATYQATKTCFTISLEIDKLSHVKTVLAEISRILDLNADTKQISEQLLSSGLSENTLINGLRIPGIWSTFEAGCRAILGQQISVTAAVKLVATLVKELGEREQQKFYFPAPAAVAESDLSFLRMPESRKATLRSFAAHCALEDVNTDLDAWKSIKGIGPWTIAYAKMRGQSQPDIWLDKDLVIKKQLATLHIDAERVRPWRSYLTFQLWSMA